MITCPTDVSLPGISEDASRIVSSAAMRIVWCSRLAMRDSADSGSPCEPVEISSTRRDGQLLGELEVDEQAVGHVQQPELAGDLHVAHHRAADQRDLPLGCHGGVEHLLHAVHVRGEAGDDDPAAAPWR